MVTLISTRLACKFVDNSISVAVVSVQLSPESRPFELVFPDVAMASEFSTRCHEDNSFAQSVATYLTRSAEK